jgi:steroid 5-alpha reductase family enzyme/acetyl esterase/lipase
MRGAPDYPAVVELDDASPGGRSTVHLARWSTGALATLLLASCSPATVLNLLAPSQSVEITRSIPYGEGARRTLDVYRPSAATAAPVVVFFYGGSWQSGSKEIYRFVGTALARRGYVAVVPDYRVYPATRYPGFLEDGAHALRWAKDNAARFSGDPDKLFVMGHSAGAYMAAMLALDGHWLEQVNLTPSRDIAGLIGISGPYDFLPLRDETLQTIFGGPNDIKTQPIFYVAPGAPPALLLTGANDDTVDPGNASRLAARLRASGDEATVLTYSLVGHLSIIGAIAWPLRLLAPVLRDVDSFITKTAAETGTKTAARAGGATHGGDRAVTVAQFVILVIALAAALSVIMSVAWVVWRHSRNSGWVDTIWTFGLGATGYIAALTIPGPMTTRRILVALLIGSWSLRLGLHIARRTARIVDDPRYAKLLREWGAKAPRQMFVLLQKQALVSIPLALSVALAAWNPLPDLRVQDILAVLILLVAIAGEGVADAQLRRFRSDPANRNRVCEIGLWGWSRHPNYFFEWFGWIAYPLLAIDLTNVYPWGWIAIAGPLCMYWLLVHVSGIPPLEDHMLERRGDAFRAYQARTNAFFPAPPRVVRASSP